MSAATWFILGRRSAPVSAWQTGLAVARITALAQTTNREWSSIPVTILTSAPPARNTRPITPICHRSIARKGLAALDPQWAGGRPRLISDEDIEVIVTAARTRPEKPVRPFTRWSLRKLAAYLAEGPGVRIGRERLRQVLHARGISFQRTRTWKESAIRTGTPS